MKEVSDSTIPLRGTIIFGPVVRSGRRLGFQRAGGHGCKSGPDRTASHPGPPTIIPNVSSLPDSKQNHSQAPKNKKRPGSAGALFLKIGRRITAWPEWWSEPALLPRVSRA